MKRRLTKFERFTRALLTVPDNELHEQRDAYEQKRDEKPKRGPKAH